LKQESGKAALPQDEETALMIVIEYRGYANGGEVVNKQ
jgi:hypothetical protein